MKVERARERDYPELMDLMVRCFRVATPDHPRFEKLLPDLYRPDEASVARHRIIREGGRIVSSIGVYPIDVRVGPVRLHIAGIGAVSTEPEHRGKGHMSAILEQIRADMVEEGYALSWLSGIRERYTHFGWERAGSGFRVTLSVKEAEQDSVPWETTQWDPEHSLQDVIRARENLACSGLCSEEELALKFQRLNVTLWETRNRDRYAFCAVQSHDKQVVDWGGDPDGVRILVDRHVAGKGTWSAVIPPLRDAYSDLFLSRATDVGCALENLAVVDPASLLRAYEPHLTSCWPTDRVLRLRMGGEQSVAGVTLAGGRVADRVDGGSATVEIGLDRLQAVRFLFGPARPSLLLDLDAGARWLDEVFPLPFHMPYLWRV